MTNGILYNYEFPVSLYFYYNANRRLALYIVLIQTDLVPVKASSSYYIHLVFTNVNYNYV